MNVVHQMVECYWIPYLFLDADCAVVSQFQSSRLPERFTSYCLRLLIIFFFWGIFREILMFVFSSWLIITWLNLLPCHLFEMRLYLYMDKSSGLVMKFLEMEYINVHSTLVELFGLRWYYCFMVEEVNSLDNLIFVHL